MATPKVSVLIPCFNLGAYVEEAVASVRAQTRQDLELVVVDDGSTDPATREVLARLPAPDLTLVTTENRGLAAARNTALARARGEYVCALDADDLLEPTFVEKTAGRLDADRTLTFVSTWLRAFGAEDWVWEQRRCDLPMLLAEDTVLTAALVRRDAVLEAGGYDGGMGAMGYEDWELWLTLVERGHRGAIIPEPLFRYRRRAGSMTADCTRADVHLRLLGYLHGKHASSYRRHALEVLALKELEAGRLAQEEERLERELREVLEPQRASLAAELERLRQKLSGGDGAAGQGALEQRVRALEAELAAARDEVAALRASRSWRLTRPLRSLYELLPGAARGRPR